MTKVKLTDTSTNRTKEFSASHAERILKVQLSMKKSLRAWVITESNKFTFNEQEGIIERVKKSNDRTKSKSSSNEEILPERDTLSTEVSGLD